MNGKSRCKILKEIRRQIAEQNDIELITSECKHKGDCAGTCPKCESEVRYLEKELKKREMLGKTVVVAGLALALTTSAVGCMSEIKDDTKPDEEKNDDRYTETDGAMVALPEISVLLSLSSSERNEYISRYERYEIRGFWNNNSAILGDTLDIFYVPEDGIEYRIEVTYDEDGKPVSVGIELSDEEEWWGDPAW